MNDLICGFELDNNQKQVIIEESKHVLVIASAGSGKTLTILGKINYLIKYKNIKEEEIICISFTNKACDSLIKKLNKMNYNINIYTFHKLALEIIKHNNYQYSIADDNLLESITNNFFNQDVLYYPNFMKYIMNYYGLKKNKNIKQEYTLFLNRYSTKLNILKKNIITFIKIFKSNNYNLNDFITFYDKTKTGKYGSYKKNKIFLILCINIYIKYYDYMDKNQLLDFDDMIILATNYIKKNGFHKNIKYIIIDEYQDTSLIRFNLINEILNQTSSHLLSVGDDFQSIYQFSGCHLDLFTNFKNYFNDCKILKLENTYRNSQELITQAGTFIMKNKKQIKKDLISSKRLDNPLKIIYYKDITKDFKKLITDIHNKYHKTIMILGRNNNDINYFIDDTFSFDGEKLIYKNNENINMYYLTVHKAKGLEEDIVIIINLNNSFLGFPNKINENKILKLVTTSDDNYLFAEERRLFYVALTRTKGPCFLFASKQNPSVFVKEIEKIIKKTNVIN